MRRNIFYSWQSDLPNKDNRTLIQDCLQRSVKSYSIEDEPNLEIVIDRDTSGLNGSPDISNSILEKISIADIFIADVTIINSQTLERPTPNPNVLIEVGYAAAKLGWDRIILVQNSAFGGPDLLPFDLRGRRVIVYAPDITENRAAIRAQIRNGIENILTPLFQWQRKSNLPSGYHANLWWGEWERDSGYPTSGFLRIREIIPGGFVFDLEVVNGAHTGAITAFARIVADDLAYCSIPTKPGDPDGELTFRRSITRGVRSIQIRETESCSYWRGARAYFSGDYQRERDPWFDSGLMNEIEIIRLNYLVGKNIKAMRQCASSIHELDCEDEEISARVVSGGVPGLYSILECIVMFNKNGEIWAAYIEDSTIKYYTNVYEYKSKLPKTFRVWATNFAQLSIEYYEPVSTFTLKSFCTP